MNYGVWNVRGLNKDNHQLEVVNFIKVNKLSFVSLFETKVKHNNSITTAKKIKRNWKWWFNYDHHYNGRVWVGWDASVWEISLCSSSAQHISVLVKFLEKQINFMVTFVYAYNEGSDRVALWDYLASVNTSLPWSIALVYSWGL